MTTPAERTNFVRVGEHEPQETTMTTTEKEAIDVQAYAIGNTVDQMIREIRYDLTGDQMRAMSEVDDAKLRETLRHLCTEIVALRKDKARVDWLEQHCTQLDFDDDERTVDVIHGGRNDRQWTEVGRGRSLRDALDTAMEAP